MCVYFQGLRESISGLQKNTHTNTVTTYSTDTVFTLLRKSQNSGPTLYSGGHCYDCPYQIRNRIQWLPSWIASDRHHTRRITSKWTSLRHKHVTSFHWSKFIRAQCMKFRFLLKGPRISDT